MQYAGLSIQAIALHQVVRKVGGVGEPILSETESTLDDEQRGYIHERVRSALGQQARPIVEDSGASTVPDEVRKYFVQAEDLLATSVSLAKRLQAAQPGVSPGGIFLTADVDHNGNSALLLAKLEHERGVRASQRTLPDGRTTFNVQYLRDLLFTSGSRVHKVALFSKPTQGAALGSQSSDGADHSPDLLTGVVVDQQGTASSIAGYFLSTFLGCRFSERSDLLTQRFFDGTEAWVNSLADAEKKGRYQVALLSEMQSNRSTVSVNRFAADHLELNDRDDYVATMKRASVPAREFAKDTNLVRGRLQRLKISTASGVVVLAPTDTVENGTVEIVNNEDDTSTVIVRDTLTQVSGNGRASVSRERHNEP